MVAAPATPATLTVRWDEIPAELVSRPQWVAWAWEFRREQWTKAPIDVKTGGHASSTDAATWAPFEAARSYAEARRLPGAGYVFAPGDPYAGVDLDRCRDAETGALAEWARAIVDDLDSYAEASPRGAGVKLVARAVLPPGRRKDTATGIELYDRGRFFTLTGHRLPGVPAEPQPRQAKVAAFHARVFPAADPSANGATEPSPTGSAPPDDATLIARAMRAKNGARFGQLWAGTAHEYGSDSEADAALCAMLAFWTGPDRARVDRLFRQSARYRTKWERENYREPTLDLAFRDRVEYHDWAGADDGARLIHVVSGEAAETTEGPSQDPRDYPLSDTGDAKLYAARFGEELRHDHRRQAWLRWGGHWWIEDADGYALRLTERITRARAMAAEQTVDKDERKAGLKWSLASQSGSHRERMLKFASVEHPLTAKGDGWDGDPWLLGVANGVVDLRSGELHPGHQRDYVTMHSPIAYDPRSRSPRFERFIREVFLDDEELIAYVQRCVGYSLSGNVSEQVLFLCYGRGGNGKGVLFRALAHVLGDYAINVPFSTLELQATGTQPTNDLALLVGRRFVTSSETNEARRLNEARVKSLTGQDPITARPLYKDFFTFTPVAKFWLAVNHHPRVTDDSDGFWRRVREIPFLARFDETTADRDLDEKLAVEAAGILAWGIRGCLAWQRGGLAPPASVQHATAAYRSEMDLVSIWLEDRCRVGQGESAAARALYESFAEWCKVGGEELLSQRAFGLRLGERGFAQAKSQGERRWRGLSLIPRTTFVS